MQKYGLTLDDLKYCREKIDNQRSYLSNNHFQTSTGQIKSLLDVSFSANISERYYSQLSNKINTMSDLAKSQNLKPTFLTITLDGFFRGFLTANYKKWDRLTHAEQFEYLRHIPNNETHGFLHEKIDKRLRFTIKDCYNVLAYQWMNYAKSYSFKNLKKSGKKFIYLKAVEPHKDGVPHFHVLLWIPENYFDSFKKDFERYFPAPQNHKPIENGNEGDTKGFQTAIYNPVGYIMKYATKSFMDMRTGEDLNYLQSWYIKHKIRRITTSHSTIPQWVYQKCYAVEKDWYHLTDLNLREPLLCEWNKEDDWFHLIEDNGRSIEYDQGLLTLSYIDGPIITQLGVKTERTKVLSSKIEEVPSKWINPHQYTKHCEVYFDGSKHILKNQSLKYQFDLRVYQNEFIDKKYFFFVPKDLIKITPEPLKMSNFELLNYWQNMDHETVHPHHYAHVQNELVVRGLLQGNIVSLNNMYTGNPFDDENTHISFEDCLYVTTLAQLRADRYNPFEEEISYISNVWGD
jgi:hypothetical protein